MTGWLAIELLTFEEGLEASHSEKSDVWAFDMTVYVSSMKCSRTD